MVTISFTLLGYHIVKLEIIHFNQFRYMIKEEILDFMIVLNLKVWDFNVQFTLELMKILHLLLFVLLPLIRTRHW